MRAELDGLIRRFFDAALELPPGERASFLRLHCSDTELRAEVERLLSAHENLGSFLEAPSYFSSEDGYVVPISHPTYSETMTITQPEQSLPIRIKNRYSIEKELGRGGLGVVYLARDEKLHGRQVVVKFLLDAQRTEEDILWVRSKFKMEKEALARINHSSVVGILECGEWNDRPFIVMEYINGETLRSVINNERLSFARTAEIVRQIGRALTAAHKNHVYHRDLKPANIMLQDLGDGAEMVKLIDFGIATVKHSQTVASHDHTKIVGSLPYMAPEQLIGKPSAASDIYALGVIAYEMLTGRLPFKTGSHIEMYNLQGEGKFARPSALRPDLPSAAEAAILKAMSFSESERYQSAIQFGDELFRALVSTPSLGVAGGVTPAEEEAVQTTARVGGNELAGQRAMILYKRNAQPDERLVKMLEEQLRACGCQVFIDRHLRVGAEWAREIERQLREADFVIPLLSAASAGSVMLAQEVRIACEASRQQGKPRLLPARVNFTDPLPETLGAILDPIQYAFWSGPQDDGVFVAEIIRSAVMPAPIPPSVCVVDFEPVGGAMPPGSGFYIRRPTDQEFLSAIARRDSIVLVKGARQMGKTSLLARGLRQARESGARIVLTDFQMFNESHLADINALFLAFAESIAEQLDLDFDPAKHWHPHRGANVNFARFMRREVIDRLSSHLVWSLDEVDRLFTRDFGGQVFALFRSWHNARALDPASPWHKLTMAIAYATEAHLFITDINQSPFNVGTRLALNDFTPEQVAELNHRYGYPLRDEAEAARFYRLVGGQPYLVRRGLHEMAVHKTNLAAFEEQADRDEGPLSDHLRRILFVLAQKPALCDAVREVLQGQPCPSAESFFRLRSAGVMAGDSAREARMRCQIYAAYLKRHLL